MLSGRCPAGRAGAPETAGLGRRRPRAVTPLVQGLRSRRRDSGPGGGQPVSPPPSVFEAGKARALHPPSPRPRQTRQGVQAGGPRRPGGCVRRPGSVRRRERDGCGCGRRCGRSTAPAPATKSERSTGQRSIRDLALTGPNGASAGWPPPYLTITLPGGRRRAGDLVTRGASPRAGVAEPDGCSGERRGRHRPSWPGRPCRSPVSFLSRRNRERRYRPRK